MRALSVPCNGLMPMEARAVKASMSGTLPRYPATTTPRRPTTAIA